jgi:hypothetical protein
MTGVTKLCHHREAVLSRQHHVQNHHIESRSGGKQIQGLFTRPGYFDFIAFGFQIKAQSVSQMPFILYDENAIHFAMGS